MCLASLPLREHVCALQACLYLVLLAEGKVLRVITENTNKNERVTGDTSNECNGKHIQQACIHSSCVGTKHAATVARSGDTAMLCFLCVKQGKGNVRCQGCCVRVCSSHYKLVFPPMHLDSAQDYSVSAPMASPESRALRSQTGKEEPATFIAM